jgi:hypothetical protein
MSVNVPLGMPVNWKVPLALTSTVREVPSTFTVTFLALDAEVRVSAALTDAPLPSTTPWTPTPPAAEDPVGLSLPQPPVTTAAITAATHDTSTRRFITTSAFADKPA